MPKIKYLILAAIPVVFIGSYYYLQDLTGLNFKSWLITPTNSQFNLIEEDDLKVSISLDLVGKDYRQITDIAFVPGQMDMAIVLEKGGTAVLSELNGKISGEKAAKHTSLFKIEVLSSFEQGLLGIAFHPNYPKAPCIYLNYVLDVGGHATSRVSEWCHAANNILEGWEEKRTIFELGQPYGNHNAGHLIFDREANLYIPWGDGGDGGDPHGHGQNLSTYLGTIIRIKPSPLGSETPYTIPADNPFIKDPTVADEIYAYGLRNPWKLSFDAHDRLIAADVGQYEWEEITFIEAGGNHGWKSIEGLHCFVKGCTNKGMVMPFIEYHHEIGKSVTGGYVYSADKLPSLKNKYIYGDFVTGQIWAADLPDPSQKNNFPVNHDKKAKAYTNVYSLGQWPLLISTFAKNAKGEIFVADFARGNIFKIVEKK